MLDTGRWRDFEAGRGGGAIDLVEYLQGMDRPSALKWLQAKGTWTFVLLRTVPEALRDCL